MLNMARGLTAIFFLIVFFTACNDRKVVNKDISEVAGNSDVLNFMKTFDGRGDLTDTSQMVPAGEALKQFRIPDDITLDLVLSEPRVTQPVFITFDPRGRLWVVQYNQYPYPEGLKVLSMDQHTRAKYDKEPQPPPSNARGADKITMFEDTDNDGTFDKQTDVIKGLNLVTSVAFGYGKIWVLNPPYLLSYPDPDHNGIPDGEPVVELKGFGIEDTHAVANNLRFGPDGWLYGAQGSTCTADISSEVSKHIRFNGQAIWRYHPRTRIFEVFAEGGGNTFDVEIDDKGRLFSGDNGTSHGQYYKQGAYFIKNPGKHGAYTNLYAFGHLPNMALQGEETRFTHAFVKYSGGTLPQRYNDHMIAINPLQGFVQLTRFEQNGSTFKNIDEEKIVQTSDHWFRPVDIVTGPDGSIYIADWYDSRISHVDPRDTWNKNTGRIYRLRNKSRPRQAPFDLNKYPEDELINLFDHPNTWFRQQAQIIWAERQHASYIPSLIKMLEGTDGNLALQALWAINLSGGLNDSLVKLCFRHTDPFVRMWAVRLAGDSARFPDDVYKEMAQMALNEMHPEVRSQLAATAKKLKPEQALLIVSNLLEHDDSGDPDLPLQTWWAMEAVAGTGRQEILSLFRQKHIWSSPVMIQTILPRLIQRYVLPGSEEDIAACAALFRLAPSEEHAWILYNGLQEGLRGRSISELSPDLISALKLHKRLFDQQTLTLSMRTGKKEALQKSLKIIGDPGANLTDRLTCIKILGEVDYPSGVPVLLDVMENSSSSPGIKQAALLALQNYNEDQIGSRVVSAYPDKLRDDYDVREAALSLFASRPSWAMQLLNAIAREKKPGEQFIARTIERSDVPQHIVWQMRMLDNNEVKKTSERLWPDVRLATAEEKNQSISKVVNIVRSGSADPAAGHPLFIAKCGTCHKLFNEGRTIAPDLTGYDRKNLTDLLSNIADPSAYIREGYEAWHVVTENGRTLIGTILNKTPTSFAIQPFTGEPVVLSSAKIKNMQPLKTSIMPEMLLDDLNEKQLRDLMSYLASQKKSL